MRNFSTCIKCDSTFCKMPNDNNDELFIDVVARHAQIKLDQMTPAEERTIEELRSFLDHVNRDWITAPSVYVNVNLNTGAVSAIVNELRHS